MRQLPPLPTPPSPPTSRQLPLPWDRPPGPAPPTLPSAIATLPAQRIWTTLPSATRHQVRQTIRRILQEVLTHADDTHH